MNAITVITILPLTITVIVIAATYSTLIVWSVWSLFWGKEAVQEFYKNPIGRRCRFYDLNGKMKKGRVISATPFTPTYFEVLDEMQNYHYIWKHEIYPGGLLYFFTKKTKP
ncbi:MAG: hypothetical protein WC959_12400 [Kiritimatiellales bacterium]